MTPDDQLAWAREHAPSYVRTPEAARAERQRLNEARERRRAARPN